MRRPRPRLLLIGGLLWFCGLVIVPSGDYDPLRYTLAMTMYVSGIALVAWQAGIL